MSSRSESELGLQPGATPCGPNLVNMFANRVGMSRQERLASVIFDDIVPRLHMLHHELSATRAERAFTQEEITRFGEILIGDDSAAEDQFLQKMRARGHSEETLFLGLMSETARHLGVLWEDDRCSFVDVTIGLARLQKLLCVFNGACEAAFTDSRQRVALCALAGERHVFGVDMVACFLRCAQWEVELRKAVEPEAVADAVSREWFAVLGFTLSAESELELLGRAIQAGRAASLNPAIGVLVGGPAFRTRPDLAAQVGADAMAADAASATLLAKRLLLRQQNAHPRQDGDAAPTGDAYFSGASVQSSIHSSNS